MGWCGESKLDGVPMSMSDHAFSVGKHGEMMLFDEATVL